MSKSGRGHIIERKSEIPRLVVLIFAIAGLVAGLTLIYLFAPDVMELFQEQRFYTDNRTWITREWTQSDRSNEEVAATVQILEDNGIQIVYLQTGTWHGETGEYIELPYSSNFIQRFRRNTASIQLYTWLTVTPDRLFDEVARQQLIQFTRSAILDNGLDGVHVQGLSIPDNSEDFIQLLRDLRTTLGTQGILSITVPPDRTPADPDVPISPAAQENLTWSPDYKRRVALNVDEMVLMAHAAGLENIADYENWLAYQVATYAQVVDSLEIEMKYIVALPTYPLEIGHDPEIENTETAINGLLEGMSRARSAGSQVDGVGLYPWEETDLFELETYWNNWVSREN